MKQQMIRWGGRGVRHAGWVADRFFSRRANIIYYHAVWPAGDQRADLFGGLNLDRFVLDLRELSQRFQFVSVDNLLRINGRRQDTEDTGKPRLVLTFDDGFDLTAGGATDVMDELRIPATIFVNNSSVNYQRLMWQHCFTAIQHLRGDDTYLARLNELQTKLGYHITLTAAHEQIQATHQWPMDRKDEYVAELWQACDMPPMNEMLQDVRPYFDWVGLQDWMKRGHCVGLHTRSHPFCSLLDAQLVESELFQPADELKERLNLDTIPFAYPFGERLTPELERGVIDSGRFTCLLGTSDVFGRIDDDPNTLVRVDAEPGIDQEIFGKAVIRATKRNLVSSR